VAARTAQLREALRTAPTSTADAGARPLQQCPLRLPLPRPRRDSTSR
jgi:hypothetical protein